MPKHIAEQFEFPFMEKTNRELFKIAFNQDYDTKEDDRSYKWLMEGQLADARSFEIINQILDGKIREAQKIWDILVDGEKDETFEQWKTYLEALKEIKRRGEKAGHKDGKGYKKKRD